MSNRNTFSKLSKNEVFIKHKIQSASAFYQSVSFPNFVAYVAKDAVIGPKKRAIFLIELKCPSERNKAIHAFNQVFGSSTEEVLRAETTTSSYLSVTSCHWKTFCSRMKSRSLLTIHISETFLD